MLPCSVRNALLSKPWLTYWLRGPTFCLSFRSFLFAVEIGILPSQICHDKSMGECVEAMPGFVDKAYLTVALGAYIMGVPPLLPARSVPVDRDDYASSYF